MLKSPLIMGVLNMTPDSFSGDGLQGQLSQALERASQMVAEGAAILDIGGESTRPGAREVSPQEEMDRTLPLLEALAQRFEVLLSIDTRKVEVAEAALRSGATIVNDISGGRDAKLAHLVAQHKATILLMHMQGDPSTMQANPSYPRGVVTEVSEFLSQRAKQFEEAGISRDNIWVDPGIGFGKTLEHNLTLLKELKAFSGLGGRLAIGTSRKSFLARLLGDPQLPMELRREGTVASNLWAWEQGASVFRVHEVGVLKRAFATWGAINASK